MNIDRITITPQMASTMLEKNAQNRPLNRAHVKTLADEMRGGRWKFNGATICMNGNMLVDGQHRLHACIEANTPFDTLLVEGLSSDVFDTIDTGKKRSAPDVLAIRGEKNTALLASSLSFVEHYMTGKVLKRPTFTNTKIEELLEKYPDIRMSVRFAAGHKTRGIIPTSLVGGCHYLFSKRDGVLACEFFDKLIKGNNLDDEEPVYLLRERLLSNALNKAKLPRHEIAAITIKAWNFTRKGTRIKTLRWTTSGAKQEPFPIVE